MDSEKGNRVFAGGAQCAPPPWFLEPKKSLVWIGLINIGQKMTSNEARKVGLVTVVSLGVVSGEVLANFEPPPRRHFSLDSRQQAILV